MLTSLQVKNYRNLKDFKLDSLVQVNLITGKNNTGKTSLLEAVAIYASKGSFSFVVELLRSHGEYFRIEDDNASHLIALNMEALSSLFSDWKIGFEINNTISIVGIDKEATIEIPDNSNFVEIKFVKYDENIDSDTENAGVVNKRLVISDYDENNMDDYKTGLYISTGDRNQLIVLERNIFFPRLIGKVLNSNKIEFIKTNSIDRDNNAVLFDNIALTDKEKFIIDALKIIEPSTERIAFVGKGSRDRSAVIKLSKRNEVLPLRNMGDGINRILTIILALVNCENGFLLIDEFENGLHYTVQKQLWSVIFKLAKRLNIQVFATTHSEDCISSFEQVLSENKKTVKGKLIRLDNVNGVIKQTEFSPQELKIANEQNIELR